MDSALSGRDAQVRSLRERYSELHDVKELLDAVIHREFPGSIALLASFGAESAVLLDLVAQVEPALPVLFLDTRKLFPETLEYQQGLVRRLGLRDVRTVTPNPSNVEVADPHGRLWETDSDACCALRKSVPLRRALRGFECWITGRKRYHGGSRRDLPVFEVQDDWVKVNPLAGWSREQVQRAFDTRELPPHPLASCGYASVGCAPCTSPVSEAASPRAGRWPGSDKSECGIHFSIRDDKRAGG